MIQRLTLPCCDIFAFCLLLFQALTWRLPLNIPIQAILWLTLIQIIFTQVVICQSERPSGAISRQVQDVNIISNISRIGYRGLNYKGLEMLGTKECYWCYVNHAFHDSDTAPF